MPAPVQPGPIPAIPTAPSRSSPSDFSQKADAWAGAWGPATTAANDNFTFVGQAVVYIGAEISGATTTINEARDNGVDAVNDARDQGVITLQSVIDNAGLSGTSTSSVAIGTGSKSFTTQTGRAWKVGGWVTIADVANPTTKVMNGQVTAYDPGTGALTVDVTAIVGSGTVSDWAITSAGRPGSNASIPKASGADINAGTDDDKYVTSKALLDADAIASVAASGSFTLDMTANRNFEVTLSANSTMAVPTGVAGGGLNGQSVIIYFIQDATGSRTLALNASIKKFGAFTLSTGANAVDRCGGVIRNGVLELTALEKGLS